MVEYPVKRYFVCYSRLLCITAAFWFVFDTVIRYPFQAAVFILTLYVLRLVWNMLPTFHRNRPVDNRDAGMHASYSAQTQRQTGRNTDDMHQRDFRFLTSRIDGMEEKTNLLCDRLERLSRSVDQLTRSMSDEEGEDER